MNPAKKIFSYASANRGYLSKFIFVGIFTFIVNISIFHLLYSQLVLDYRLSVSVAWVLTVLLHFTMNRIITFRAGSVDVIRHSRRYLLMLSFNYFMTMVVVWSAVHLLGSPYLGIATSTALTAVSSFVSMRYYVFLQDS